MRKQNDSAYYDSKAKISRRRTNVRFGFRHRQIQKKIICHWQSLRDAREIRST